VLKPDVLYKVCAFSFVNFRIFLHNIVGVVQILVSNLLNLVLSDRIGYFLLE
jgi:hypothetical protein